MVSGPCDLVKTTTQVARNEKLAFYCENSMYSTHSNYIGNIKDNILSKILLSIYI